MQGGVSFAVIRTEVSERAREDRHRMRVISSRNGRKGRGKEKHHHGESACGKEPRRSTTEKKSPPARKRASVPERAEKDLCVRVDKSVRQDLVLEHSQLLRGGQRAVDEQIGRLEVGRVLRELLDRVPTVAQDAGVAIDVRDLALDDGRVEEALVGHAESLGRLVLDTFPRFERGGNRLEGGRRDGVILDPVCIVLRLSLTLLFTIAPPAAVERRRWRRTEYCMSCLCGCRER